MGGVALDVRFELGGHCAHDALSHAGGAWVGLDVEADAVVGNRQQDIVIYFAGLLLIVLPWLQMIG